MKRAITILFWAHLLAIPFGMWAQEETEVPWYLRENVWKETGNDNPRGTTSLGMPLNAPLSPIAQHVSWGLGLSVGAGYNFTRRHALVGDFLWNWLYPTNQTVRPIQIALHTNKVSGHGNLFAFTGGVARQSTRNLLYCWWRMVLPDRQPFKASSGWHKHRLHSCLGLLGIQLFIGTRS